MSKGVLKLFMDWIFSEEWGYKTWKLKDMKLPKQRVWIMRKATGPLKNGRAYCITIKIEEGHG
jgi:hypothetical protein